MTDFYGWAKEELEANPYTQPTLITHIRDKKNQRIGVIRAFKIIPKYFNETYDHDIEGSIVVIVHSKTNTNVDKWNQEKEDRIIDSRLEFCLNGIKSNIIKRNKKSSQKPTKELKDLYRSMEKRSRSYFKDCSEIYWYIDMFEYNALEENDLSRIDFKMAFENLPKSFTNTSWEQYAMQIPEPTFEKMLESDK